MNKKIALVLLSTVFLTSACNYSAGFKADAATGLSFNYKGFRVQNVLLIGPDNKPMQTNKVPFNNKVAIAIVGLENYAVKDGKVFPGMMMVVTAKDSTAVIKQADLFQDTEGFSPVQASELRGTITVAQPMKSGDTYLVKMHVWDKLEPKNQLDLKMQMIVE